MIDSIFEEKIKNAKTLQEVDDCCLQEIYSIMDFINACEEYPECAQSIKSLIDYDTLIRHCEYEIEFLEKEMKRSLLSIRKFKLAQERVKQLAFGEVNILTKEVKNEL